MKLEKERALEKGISVIVCTFNGASRLANTIKHLATQVVSNQLQWEVIVVDNASTDDSTEVARREWLKHGSKYIGFTLLKEEKPGKIYALGKAFLTARYEYAIICDDDNWLHTDYLSLVFEILENDDKIGAVGGKSVAINDSGLFPIWFKDFTDSYAVGEQALTTGDVTNRGYLWGAGMATRTATYMEMYVEFPSLLTGRLGETLHAGEDAEYSQRLVLRGFKLFYDSRLFFHHYMPETRLTKDYRDRLFKGFAKSDLILNKYYIANRYIKNHQSNARHRFYFSSIVTLFKSVFALKKDRREEAKTTLVFANLLPAPPDSVISKIFNFYRKGQANL